MNLPKATFGEIAKHWIEQRTGYYRARVSLQWKQCLQTYRLQTRAGPVSLTYSTRRECRSVRPDSHCTLPVVHLIAQRPLQLSCFPTLILISLAVTAATSLSLSQSYKQDCHRITNGVLSLTHTSQQGSANEVLILFSSYFIRLYIPVGQTWVWLNETMPKHAARLIIYICNIRIQR